jgi:hypothetical protein
MPVSNRVDCLSVKVSAPSAGSEDADRPRIGYSTVEGRPAALAEAQPGIPRIIRVRSQFEQFGQQRL